MKNFTVLLCFFIVSHFTLAQTETNTSFSSQMTTMFSPLNKNNVPHGILLDYGMEFTNVPAFNGTLTDSTYTNLTVIKQIYKTLLSSRIRNVSTGFVTPQTFDTNLKNNRATDVITLNGLYFKYATFVDNATINGKLTYSNGKFYDKYVNGVWQNPYQERKVFALTPSTKIYKGFNIQVKLPSPVFYSNNQSEVQSIQVDFDDGQGYVTIAFDQILNISYTSAGVKTWTYKLNLTNNTSIYSRSRIKVEEGLVFTSGGGQLKNANNNKMMTNSCLRPVPTSPLTASTAYLGQYGSVNLTWDDADCDNMIKKPLIVAEGFDLGVIIAPENENGYQDYGDFNRSLLASGTNLRDLLYDNDKDYDIIYVDWNNGVDYMQRNAYALQAVITWVNQQKANAGSTEQNVVLGQSMGGVIARWALADMEERSLTHDTRLFISHDAPQQGANIPASLQFMYRHGGNQYVQTGQTLGGATVTVPLLELTVGVSNYLSLLDTPAAKQLLKNTATTSYAMVNTDHTTFYNNLKNKGVSGSNGYPVNCRNKALSNGSECGNTQDFNPGDHLVNYQWNKGLSFWGDLASLIYNPLGGFLGGFFVDNDLFGVTVLGLIPGHSRYNVDFQAKSIPYGSGNQIYKGLISYTKKILWFIPVTVNITNVQINQPSGILPFDTYGGGFYNVNQFINTSTLPSGAFIRDKFSFIPTASTLDIGENNVALNDSDYLRSYVGSKPPSAPKNSPFDNYSTEFDKVNPNAGNYSHISFNPRNGDWLASELVGTSVEFTDCSFKCGNAEIEGLDTICSNEIYSVTSGLTYYNWSITEGSNLVSMSGNGTPNLTLTKNGTGSGYVTMQVSLGDNGAKCGNNFLTKRVFVGEPSVNIVRTYEWCEGKYHYITFEANSNDTNAIISWSYFAPPGSNFSENGNILQVELFKTYQGYLDIFVNASNTCGTGYSSFEEYIKKCGTFVNQPPFSALVSPNPASSEINVTTTVYKEDDINTISNEEIELDYKIYDIYGNNLYSKKHKKKSVIIKTDKLENGFYILILSNGKEKAAKSFIIKH